MEQWSLKAGGFVIQVVSNTGLTVSFQSDEQVYGTIGENRYKSKLESEDLYQFYNTEKITRASKRKAIYSSFDESGKKLTHYQMTNL